MKTVHFLTAGPSAAYPQLPSFIKEAISQNVISESHRSKRFETWYSAAEQGVKRLMGIPEDFYLVFVNSATEVFERSLQGLCAEHSFHFVNGSFSDKYYQISKQLGKKAQACKVEEGHGFYVDQCKIAAESELICVTHNESSTGVSFPTEEMAKIKEQCPQALLSVDVVSSAPFVQLDYKVVDSVFFSVQKGFGLPAGLGVWAFSKACVERSAAIEKQGLSTGTYHSLLELAKWADKKQTPITPNVLGIYLLGKVAEDMLLRGSEQLQIDTLQKAGILYGTLENSALFEAFVKEEYFRSATVVVAKEKIQGSAARVHKLLLDKGIEVGMGYGKFKDSHLRFANFPSHSRELIQYVCELLPNE